MCVTHGGAAPQVKAKAAERIEESRQRLYGLVDPAIDTLEELLAHEQGTVQYQAVRDVLDRSGFKPAEKLEVTGDLADRLLAGRRRVGLIEGGE